MKTLAKYLPLLLLLPLLFSCESDDVLDDGSRKEEPGIYLRLQLEVAGEAGSRASGAYSRADRDINNPWGGETGNHTEAAQNHENRINSAALIFYKKSLNGTLADEDKVEGVMYFTDSDFEVQNGNERTSLIKKVPANLKLTAANTYYVLVVTNITETQANAFKDMTLANLRDYTFTGDEQPMTYVSGGSTFAQQFKDFKMTSVEETPVELKTIDSKTDTYELPKIQVQRLAARIDVSFGFEEGIEGETHEEYNSIYMENCTIKANNAAAGADPAYSGPAIIYRVYEGDQQTTTENDYYVVTGIKVLNGRCTNTYLLKRTTKGDTKGNYPSSDLTWNSSTMEVFGTETATSNHAATNWVISPTLNTGNTDLINKYNDDHAKIMMKALHTDQTRRNYKLADAIGDTYSYYTLGYYAENTMAYAENARYTKIQLMGYYCRGTETSGVVSPNFTYDASVTQPTYDIPIRHSDPTGSGATGASTAPMRYGIVRNNIYPIRITMVLKLRDVVFVRYYYYPGGSTQYIEDLATPFYRYIEDDSNPGNGPSGTGDYPNDAPRRK